MKQTQNQEGKHSRNLNKQVRPTLNKVLKPIIDKILGTVNLSKCPSV